MSTSYAARTWQPRTQAPHAPSGGTPAGPLRELFQQATTARPAAGSTKAAATARA
jgi:hypothetical protein